MANRLYPQKEYFFKVNSDGTVATDPSTRLPIMSTRWKEWFSTVDSTATVVTTLTDWDALSAELEVLAAPDDPEDDPYPQTLEMLLGRIQELETLIDLSAQGEIPAASVSVDPVGTITSTNTQSALAELDTKKLPLAGGTMTGPFVVVNLTTTQKLALTPVNVQIVYDSTLNKFQGYENSSWQNLI